LKELRRGGKKDDPLKNNHNIYGIQDKGNKKKVGGKEKESVKFGVTRRTHIDNDKMVKKGCFEKRIQWNSKKATFKKGEKSPSQR